MGVENFKCTDLMKNQEQLKTEERLDNVKKVYEGFINLKPEEKVIFLIDNDPFNTDPELIRLMQEELKNRKIEFGEFVADNKTEKEELLDVLKRYDVIWHSWGMEETDVNFDDLAELVEKKGSRMVYGGGVKVNSLDNDGALSEDKGTLDEHLDKMENKLRDVAGFHITSVYGTDLWVKMKPGERRWCKSNGTIRPGGWDNLPGGEIFTTPDEENVDGVLVLPVLYDEVTHDQGVDQFVRLTFRGGKIAKIDGGESAEKLRKYLEEKSEEEKNPLSVLQCAEIAFGANSKARSAVSNPDGFYKDVMNPIAEAEKRLGTMHLGFGSSKHGEEGTEGHTGSNIHLDFVLPRNGLTVKAFKNIDDFKKGKNAERLIDEGRWRFIE